MKLYKTLQSKTIIFYERHILIKNIFNGNKTEINYNDLNCSVKDIGDRLQRRLLIISIGNKKIIMSNYSHTHFTKAINYLFSPPLL